MSEPTIAEAKVLIPYWADDWTRLYLGDCREVLRSLSAESVHCVVTSPPYWGLRDYGLPPVVWDAPAEGCEHKWGEEHVVVAGAHKGFHKYEVDGHREPDVPKRNTSASQGAFCRRCGAWRGTLGLEPTPEIYVQHIVECFREVRRVLRTDGTCWVNLGDGYFSQPGNGRGGHSTLEGGKPVLQGDFQGARKQIIPGLKPKDLIGMPWRVAFALQADGWWLRSDIIWSKPNPMPESVTDRPTRSHEYVFLLTKAARYFYDADAIREPYNEASLGRYDSPLQNIGKNIGQRQPGGKWEPENTTFGPNPAGRNKRSVWEIATQPFPDAHFATFPEDLVKPCIQAGTSERGCCPECGAPWERVVKKTFQPSQRVNNGKRYGPLSSHGWETSGLTSAETLGWRPTCKHGGEPVPAIVLDPFAGSGTVGVVARKAGRRSILIDLKAEYLEMAKQRMAQGVLL